MDTVGPNILKALASGMEMGGYGFTAITSITVELEREDWYRVAVRTRNGTEHEGSVTTDAHFPFLGLRNWMMYTCLRLEPEAMGKDEHQT